MNDNQIRKVISLMHSNESSLKILAESVGCSPYDFFRGADLTTLDLSNQDLTGMNFDGADLRFAKLNGIKYDMGAFNGSLLDKEQAWIADQYEFYAQDIFEHNNEEILIFCRFRGETIEQAVRELVPNYRQMADEAGISGTALRKARRGEVVAYETAASILKTVKAMASQFDFLNNKLIARTVLRQPVVQFLSGGINQPFIHISRQRYKDLISMREEIKLIRQTLYRNNNNNWRNTAESLEHMLGYYRANMRFYDTQIAENFPVEYSEFDPAEIVGY